MTAPLPQRDSLTEGFRSLASSLGGGLSPGEHDMLRSLLSRPAPTASRSKFLELGDITDLLIKASAMTGNGSQMHRAFIAHLASEGRMFSESSLMTPSLETRNLLWLDFLLRFLADPLENYSYPQDYFLKDYRFVSGLSVPAGAQIIDRQSRVGVRVAGKLALRHPKLAVTCAASPWFRCHTEARYLKEFNAAGWNNFYHSVSELLEQDEASSGLVATSWFYDPALENVSPRLAYLAKVPMEAGAHRVEIGTSQFDIDSATKTSSTRREMYERGKYVPKSYTLVWCRKNLIRWSQKLQNRPVVPDEAAI